MRIEWGVDQYPKGADWSGQKEKTRNTRQAISFMILFGDDKLDSGFFLAPDLPYFISFFLGENEKTDQVYYGNYWQEGGRYLCIPCDGTKGKTFVTEVNLSEKFKELFGKEPPPVSAMAMFLLMPPTHIVLDCNWNSWFVGVVWRSAVYHPCVHKTNIARLSSDW